MGSTPGHNCCAPVSEMSIGAMAPGITSAVVIQRPRTRRSPIVVCMSGVTPQFVAKIFFSGSRSGMEMLMLDAPANGNEAVTPTRSTPAIPRTRLAPSSSVASRDAAFSESLSNENRAVTSRSTSIPISNAYASVRLLLNAAAPIISRTDSATCSARRP